MKSSVCEMYYLMLVMFNAETYDMNKIIEYPGFNVATPPGTVDVSALHVILYMFY